MFGLNYLYHLVYDAHRVDHHRNDDFDLKYTNFLEMLQIWNKLFSGLYKIMQQQPEVTDKLLPIETKKSEINSRKNE